MAHSGLNDQRSGYDTRRNVRDRMAAAPRGPPAVGAAPSAHGRCLPPRLAQSNTAFTYTSTVPASTDKGLHAISRPVHSVYGWHIFEVMAITPARLTSFASAKASIKTEHTNKALALPTRWSASTSRSRPSRGQRGSALRRADRHIRDRFEQQRPVPCQANHSGGSSGQATCSRSTTAVAWHTARGRAHRRWPALA